MASFLRVLVLFAAASAPASGFAPRGMRTMATALGAEKINTKIDLESDKVVTMDELESGKKKVYCRCWLSGTFPLCDGTHAKHNEATGDNVGPLIVKAAK